MCKCIYQDFICITFIIKLLIGIITKYSFVFFSAPISASADSSFPADSIPPFWKLTERLRLKLCGSPQCDRERPHLDLLCDHIFICT